MAKSGMEFSGHGNGVREQSPHSIEGLVASGFIDESGQLTERVRRAMPRRGVEILTPVQTQERTIGSHLLENIQQPCRVVADKALFSGAFSYPQLCYPQVERKGHIFKRGYIAVCQDPILVDIVKQLKSTAQVDQPSKLTLRSMGTLGLGSFIAGGGTSLLSSGEPLLTTAGAVVGGTVGAVGAQLKEKLTERKWLEDQLEQLGRTIHDCSDNIVINLDIIDKALTDESLQSKVGVGWFYDMSRFNADFDFSIRGVLLDDIQFIFLTPRYNQAALNFANRYQEYQATCDAIQCEWEAREVRDSVGIPTCGYSQLKERKDHAHEFY